MDRESLAAYLEQVRARIARLDEEEPEPMGSEAHEAGGNSGKSWRTWLMS